MDKIRKDQGLTSLCEEVFEPHLEGRMALQQWKNALSKNPYESLDDLRHSVQIYFPDDQDCLHQSLHQLGQSLPRLEELASENDYRLNLPRLEAFDGIGQRIEKIIHHPVYDQCGDLIYGTSMMKMMSEPGGLLRSLCHFYLTSMAGEAGHNCPVACTAGIIRIFQKTPEFEGKSAYLAKLIEPRFSENFTGAQFLTEVQGGSDVGLNAVKAEFEDGTWRISGEKWFCSNANADLILLTARFGKQEEGTRGLGLFLVPKRLQSGELNRYTIRRLKEKLGTRSMASGEIDFRGAIAIPMGEVQEGFKLVMENVLNLSRIYNTFTVMAMARRAYQISRFYAENRVAFGRPIINYPLVQESLARVRSENSAIQAAAFHLTHLQDEMDLREIETETEAREKLLLRFLTNSIKYISSAWSVGHIRQCIEILGGNGAIESFSTLPRLFRDSIVCENWEGTHNTLRAQILRDILKYHIHEPFFEHVNESLSQCNQVEEIEIIRRLYEECCTEIDNLKQLDTIHQSLRIRHTLDRLCVLHLSTALVGEVRHELEKGNASKLGCLRYFLLKNASEHCSGTGWSELDLIQTSA